jgi:hypothetical protein
LAGDLLEREKKTQTNTHLFTVIVLIIYLRLGLVRLLFVFLLGRSLLGGSSALNKKQQAWSVVNDPLNAGTA